MRVWVMCGAVLAAVSAAWAAPQAALPPEAFGALGIYPARLSCADLPVFGVPTPAYRLTAVHGSDGALRRAYAPPDTLALPGGMSAGLQTGQRFFVRRLLLSPNHAKPSAAAPGVVHTAGWITIVGSDPASALARIDHACDGFLKGDYLEPFAATPMPTAVAAAGTPLFTDMGQLLFGTDGRRSFANGDLIAINRGASHGLTAGARLSVFRDVKTDGPLVPIGHAIVLAVTGETATIVADRVRDALRSGDWVALEGPAPPR